MAVTVEQVIKLYIATFNRAGDKAGIDYWVNDSGLTIEQIAQSFFDQAETKAKYPESTTNEEFVTAIYLNVFGRALDPDNADDKAGLDYWVNELESGNMTKSVMIEAMKNGAQGDDSKLLENKTVVAEYFYEKGLNKQEDAIAVLSDVTADETTVTGAKENIDKLAEQNQTANFTLTSGTDNITGTEGDDLIKSTIGTWTSNDKIEDASTTDNDEFKAEINADISTTTSLKNIEKVSITTLTNRQIDATTMVGTKEINNAESTGVLTINNASLDIDYVVTSAVGGMTLNFDAGSVNGGTDLVNVSLGGTGSATVTTGAGVETLRLDLDADASLLDINTQATTVQFTGGKAFTLNSANSFDNTVTTIDARDTSGFTAGVTQAATGTAILTGSGDDSLITVTAIGANDVFSLGLGSDTITTTTNAGTGAAAVYQGVENIISDVASDNFNMTNSSGSTAFTFKGGTTVTTTNMQAGSTVVIDDDATTNIALGFATAVSGEAFTLDAQSVVNGTVAVTNASEVTLDLNGAAAATNITGITLDDASGDGSDTTKKVTINANTTLTGTANITNTDKATDLTVNANGNTTLGTFAEATALANVTLNATKGSITIGAIGGTNASTALANVNVNATAGAVNMGDVMANNASGITAVNIDATGGKVNNIAGNGATTINNTSGNIGTVTVKGAYDVLANFTAGSGNVETVNAADLTGALTTTITNAAVGNAEGTTTGSTVTLGNVVSGSTNTVNLTGTSVANSVTGGTGQDTIIVNVTTATAIGGKDTLDGGAGNDTLDGGGNADTLTGGAGSDIFQFNVGGNEGTASASANALTGSELAAIVADSMDVITDYSGTSRGQKDKITLDGGTIAKVAAAVAGPTAGNAAISAASIATFDQADNTIAEQIVAVATSVAGSAAGTAVAWVNGADSYIYMTDGVAGFAANDVVIKVTGVAVTDTFDVTGGQILDIA